MSKEMYISSSPHETKVAVLEDDLLVEVHFERDTDVGLVGGIYKGRVSRVLPGMQSAFVDVGLDRDAFLYVSDFYEDQEEYDKVFEEAEARATKLTTQEGQAAAAPVESRAPLAVMPPPMPAPMAVAPPPITPVAVTTPPVAAVPVLAPPAPPAARRDSHDSRPFDQKRGRHRRHRGRPGFSENRFAERKFTSPPPTDEPSGSFEILPGESLAKYRHGAPTSPPVVDDGSAEESHELTEGEGYSTEAALNAEAPAEAVSEPIVAIEAGAHDLPEPAAAVPLPEPPPSEAHAEVAQPTAPFTPAVIESRVPSTPTETASREAAEEPIAVNAVSVAEPEPETATVAMPEPVVPVPEPQPAAVFTPPYSQVEEDVETEPARPTPVAAEPATEPRDDDYTPAPAVAGDDATEESETDEAVEEMGAPEEDEMLAGTALPVEGEVPTGLPEGASGESSTGGTEGSSGDRSYTLREQQQRPRFAPRRRRGRRGGPGGGSNRRPEGRQESSRPGNNQPVPISELLKEGQEIIVQIAKEPLGTKGARITSHVALPGRYLVYMPTITHIGVSRKIASEEERLRLRNIILEHKGALTGGFIVRTAGQGRSLDEFKADLKFLSTLWNEIRSKAERLKAPALLHRDLDLVQRLLRDLLTPDFKTVRVDSEIDYERVLDFVNRCQPALIGKVKLYTRDTPLYEEFGIQTELDKALKPKVWLKSGGYIVLNQTEALVAVDVNTGKYVGKTNRLEDTIVKTNIDAVNEIVRQIRLRDLGGIIVIDFIDMDERKNRAKVVQALEEALRSDRAPTKVISFNDFGLVAITRKRVKQSLERTLCEPCSYCTGSGWIKSTNTICNEILAEARKMAKQIDGDVITLRVNPEVAKALKARDGSLVSELELLTKKDVIIKGDSTVHQERFEIF
jgi:Rne/Rng family ribonuclease